MRAAQVCIEEMKKALEWAEEHTKTKHADLAYHPRFSFREGSSTGITIPVLFTCETCDQQKVKAENSIRVTCLEDI